MSNVFCANCQKLVSCGFEFSKDEWMYYYRTGRVLFHGDRGCTAHSEQLSKPSPIHEGKYSKFIVENPEELNKNNDCGFFVQKEKPITFWSVIKEIFKL